ncbi:MAG: magnesium transporter [Candidatus Thermochlorobacter aerophilum]|jgi:magnesium transporter|uniref:Magnesium transporter MgtE n=1 Tax=Candidatus Thermochlorobacter aerophilus TaxID=1868324 RepID=A0A395LX03_9BACT|nr:MAG: magnesium transporter [Candidatus Thermochlorobacter aerophilum]
MRNELLFQTSDSELKQRLIDYASVLNKMPVVEVAELLEKLESDYDRIDVMSQFPIDRQALILADLPVTVQLSLFNAMSRKAFATIFEQMPTQSQVDFFQFLSKKAQTEILPFLSKSVRENILRLSAYPPDTAGGIMSLDYASVFERMTCAEAIAKVRADAPSKKLVYYAYVVNDEQTLLGFVTLKDLIMADPAQMIADVVHREFVFAYVDEDREEVAKKIEKYDLIAIPVVNRQMQLMGVVTHDEAIDIIRAEHTEDLEKFMGIAQRDTELNYLETSSWKHFQKRVTWVVTLAAVGIISGMIIHNYEKALEKMLILALYMPMVADTGGNVGSQAATVIVRALALGEFSVREWLKVIWKETKVSSLLALCLGVLAFAKVLFLSWETEIPAEYSLVKIAFVISLALSFQVITATLIGAALPLIVKAFGGDPAVAASPAITTVVDITGLLIYFGVASLFFAF